MKIEEVEGLADHIKVIDMLKKQVEGQEQLVQKFKTDIGEVRAISPELKEIKEKIDKFVDSSTKKNDNVDVSKGSVNTQGGNSGGGTQTQVEDVSKNMTADQRARADEVFKTLKPEDRVSIFSDPLKRNAFLKAAMEAAPVIPESVFGNESAKKPEEDGREEFRKFFGLGNKVKNFVPSGRSVGASGFDGASSTNSNSEPAPKRLIGGKIPRPQTLVTQTK